jgi:nicotinamidase-related amidase
MPSQRTLQSALIVIDMQRALFAASQRPHDADFVIRRVCALIDRARRDDVQIVFVQNVSDAFPHGSDGWRLLAPMEPRFPDWVIDKTRPSIFHGTNLSAQLKAVGISRLIMAGARTDTCIDTSCRVAADLGFEVVLAADAHTTFDGEVLPADVIIAHHNATLAGPFASVVAADSVGFWRGAEFA